MTSDRQLHEIISGVKSISFNELKAVADYDSPRLLKNALERLIKQGCITHGEAENSYSIRKAAPPSKGPVRKKRKTTNTTRNKPMSKAKVTKAETIGLKDDLLEWCQTIFIKSIPQDLVDTWKERGQVKLMLRRYAEQLQKHGAIFMHHNIALDALARDVGIYEKFPAPSDVGKLFPVVLDREMTSMPINQVGEGAISTAIGALKTKLNTPAPVINPVENITVKLTALEQLSTFLDPSIGDCLISVAEDLKRLQAHSKGLPQ